MTDMAKFLGYDSVDLANALFSIIPAPYEADSTYVGGQKAAPRAIIDASSQIEDYDEETGLNLIEQGVHTVAPESAPDSNDGLGSSDTLRKWVREQVTNALEQTAVPIIFGGDGTISLWVTEALLPKCEELSILHLDSHADLSEAEEDDESHHTVMRRVLELKPQPHICQVGVRSLTREGFDKIVNDDVPVESFFMSDLYRADDDSWHEDVIQELRSPVYISIDLSVFDPAVVPGVAHPEPGGMQWWPVLRLLKKVASRRRIAGFDITGLAPRPGQINSDYTAARLAYKLMNYIYSGGKMLPKDVAETEAAN